MIKKADLKNISEIMSIESENYETPWSYSMFMEDYKSDLSEIFISTDGSVIHGYMIIRKLFEEIELHNISVSKRFRNMGIASKLLYLLIEKYTEKTIFLEVRDDNLSAINLYEKFGFNYIGRRKNYYGTNIDAFVMKLYSKGVQNVKDESESCPGIA